MDHLLHSEKIAPSAITLVGDSAGAHLILGLLLHCKHANPQVPPLEVDGCFSGAALVSPWASLVSSSESAKANGDKDVLKTVALDYWVQNFLAGTALDYWTDPLSAPAEWWSDLPVRDILLTYGDHELFRDDAQSLCEMLQTHHPQTTTASFPGEVHAQMMLNRFLRINQPCASEEVFSKWFHHHLDATSYQAEEHKVP
jgi:acetyl esterase/lipase